ncbi:DUF2703 domain-containing protein [Candidatus Azambacteria bacterium]|nr:DUF2703 domain-containing protein [Candidatus Azambacteria bacterium]
MFSFLLLHNRDCHVWEKFLKELEEWLRGKQIGGTVEVREVTSDEEARTLRFFGSPQLLVNGKDVDPMAKDMSNFHAIGCRLYFWDGKTYEQPPLPMVERALKEG